MIAAHLYLERSPMMPIVNPPRHIRNGRIIEIMKSGTIPPMPNAIAKKIPQKNNGMSKTAMIRDIMAKMEWSVFLITATGESVIFLFLCLEIKIIGRVVSRF